MSAPIHPKGAGRERPARARLVRAARELLEERGYAALRVSEVAAHADLSRETFYKHFPGKRSCAAAATDPELEAIEARLQAAEAEDRPWAAPLLDWVGEALAGVYEPHDSQRQRALEAMLALAGERGYRATRLAEVAEAARLTPAELGKVFEGKRQCFAAACAQLIAWIEAEAQTPRGEADSSPSEAGAELALRALVRILAAEPGHARVLLVEISELEAAPSGDPRLATAHSFAELVERLLFGDAERAPSPAGARLVVGAVAERLRADAIAGDFDALSARAEDLWALLGAAFEDARDAAGGAVALLPAPARTGSLGEAAALVP